MSPEERVPIAKVDGRTVIVVGAGPVGLFTSLKLAQANITVLLVEKLASRSLAPRAGGYYGGCLLALREAGLYEIMLKEGYLVNRWAFRGLPTDDDKGGKSYGKQYAVLSTYQPARNGKEPEDGLLLLPQSELVKILEQEVNRTGLVHRINETELQDLREEGDRVIATVRHVVSGAVQEISGAYLVGADGGKSTVRRLLGIKHVGHTWPERLVALDIHLTNLEEEVSCPFYLIDKLNWGAIIPLSRAERGTPSLWRYSLAIDPADTRPDQDITSDDNLAKILEKVMPGKRPLQYDIRRRTVYTVHQRLASTMKRGRCLLAGDAAHLCNTMGGMGLSTGILDAAAAADALVMVVNEKYPDKVLDLYSDARRHVFGFFVDPRTTQNKARLANDAAIVAKEDGFLRLLNEGPVEERMRQAREFFEIWKTDMRKKAKEYGVSNQCGDDP